MSTDIDSTETDEQTAKVIEEYGQEVYDAAVACFGADYATDALENGAYQGPHGSVRAYAESYIDGTGMLSDWPELAQRYFDFEAFGRDMELGGDIVEHDGHIFSANW